MNEAPIIMGNVEPLVRRIAEYEKLFDEMLKTIYEQKQELRRLKQRRLWPPTRGEDDD